MGFRITTNMMMNTYKFNLQNSTKKLSDARDQVMTQRKFNSYAEDPAAATLAFRLRRDYYKTNNYLNNTKDVYSKFNTAWHNLNGVVEDLSDTTARVASIRGNNGEAGESRKALATVLRETANSVIHSMNQKLGDHFIFAGNDALNVPFSWDGETLLYRGVNVNAGGEPKPDAAAPDWLIDARKAGQAAGTWTKTDEAWFNFYSGAADSEAPDITTRPKWANDMLSKKVTDEGEKAWLSYYKDRDDLAKLESMSKEEMYIDLGMGAEESSPNNPVKGSYFNNALAGIDFIGFGVDADGDPKNMALIMRELADIFETWGENGQMYLPEEYRDKSYEDIQAILKEDGEEAKILKDYHAKHEADAFRLMDKMKAAQEETTEKWVELDARSVFLQTNESRLSTQAKDINNQILDVEQVDLAEAITNFSWGQYCYNAALKIGNQLLSQSLIDYMN